MGSVTDAFTWLDSVLTGDAVQMNYLQGVINRDYALPATLAPYVIMSRAGGLDVVTATARRIYSDDTYQVKVVGPASMITTIASAYDRLDVLINRQSNYEVAGRILSCYREQPFHVTELVNGQPWDNLGGLYRIEIESM
jgi:hypothetical protein